MGTNWDNIYNCVFRWLVGLLVGGFVGLLVGGFVCLGVCWFVGFFWLWGL